MDRSEFKVYIQENYGIEPDYPWIEYPDYAVFRHNGNKKWFALVMGVPKNKFGLPGCENLQKGTQIVALWRIQTQSLVARRESLGKNTAGAALTNEVEPRYAPRE